MLQPNSFKVFTSNARNRPALEQVGIKLFGEKLQHFTVTGVSNLSVSSEHGSTYVVVGIFFLCVCVCFCDCLFLRILFREAPFQTVFLRLVLCKTTW